MVSVLWLDYHPGLPVYLGKLFLDVDMSRHVIKTF